MIFFIKPGYNSHKKVPVLFYTIHAYIFKI